jgi:hypothetical protein
VTPQARPSSACVNRRRFRAFLSIMPDLLKKQTLAVLLVALGRPSRPRDRRVPAPESSVVTVMASLTEGRHVALREGLDLAGRLEAVVTCGVVIEMGDSQNDFNDADAIEGLGLAATDHFIKPAGRVPRPDGMIPDAAEFTPPVRPRQDRLPERLPHRRGRIQVFPILSYRHVPPPSAPAPSGGRREARPFETDRDSYPGHHSPRQAFL